MSSSKRSLRILRNKINESNRSNSVDAVLLPVTHPSQPRVFAVAWTSAFLPGDKEGRLEKRLETLCVGQAGSLVVGFYLFDHRVWRGKGITTVSRLRKNCLEFETASQKDTWQASLNVTKTIAGSSSAEYYDCDYDYAVLKAVAEGLGKIDISISEEESTNKASLKLDVSISKGKSRSI
jgi:hypothetical protein